MNPQRYVRTRKGEARLLAAPCRDLFSHVYVLSAAYTDYITLILKANLKIVDSKKIRPAGCMLVYILPPFHKSSNVFPKSTVAPLLGSSLRMTRHPV